MLSLSPPQPSSSSTPHPESALPLQLEEILQQGWLFSRMLHASRPSSGSSANAFYRAFMPDLGSGLDPNQVSSAIQVASSYAFVFVADGLDPFVFVDRARQTLPPLRTRRVRSCRSVSFPWIGQDREGSSDGERSANCCSSSSGSFSSLFLSLLSFFLFSQSRAYVSGSSTLH